MNSSTTRASEPTLSEIRGGGSTTQFRQKIRNGQTDKSSRRRYLPSTERKREILEAAFDEFSRRGFLATSLERIASRAGLSKSGIYAHYRSKNDIFEDMLLVTLTPSEDVNVLLQPENTGSLHKIVEDYLDRLYAKLNAPRAVAVFRLLIAESGRMPGSVQSWSRKLLAHCHIGEQAFVDACVKRGSIRQGISTEQYLLAMSPALLWLAQGALLGRDAPVAFAQIRELHQRLLLDLLRPSA